MEETNQQPSQKNKVSAGAEDAWTWWNTRASFREGDSLGTKFKKVGIRIAGIIALVVFSPVLLFALVVSFIVAL